MHASVNRKKKYSREEHTFINDVLCGICVYDARAVDLQRSLLVRDLLGFTTSLSRILHFGVYGFQSIAMDRDKLLLKVYQINAREFQQSSAVVPRADHSHLHTSSTVLGPLYWARYLLRCIPLSSFFCNKSILLRKRIKSTFTSSLFRHISRHRSIESSIRYILGSSSSRWSKAETGARKRIALTERINKNQTRID